MSDQKKYTYLNDPYEELEKISQVCIKPSHGIQNPSRIDLIYTIQNEDSLLFRCLENTKENINCYKPDTRPFNLLMKEVKSEEDENNSDFNQCFGRFDKPFKCCGRPTMECYVMDNFIGKVSEGLYCCGLDLQIFDSNNSRKFVVSVSNPCNCGYVSRGCCTCCKKPVELQILDGSNVCGKINLNCRGVEEDKIIIDFPSSSTKEQKIILCVVSMMYDFKFYRTGYI